MNRRNQMNVYLGIGMMMMSVCFILKEIEVIPDWLRLIGLIFAIILMLYGIVKNKKQDRN